MTKEEVAEIVGILTTISHKLESAANEAGREIVHQFPIARELFDYYSSLRNASDSLMGVIAYLEEIINQGDES